MTSAIEYIGLAAVIISGAVSQANAERSICVCKSRTGRSFDSLWCRPSAPDLINWSADGVSKQPTVKATHEAPTAASFAFEFNADVDFVVPFKLHRLL